MSSSNQRLDLRTSLQGSSSFLQIESVNPDNFSFDANSQLNLSNNLTVQDLTLNGDFINNGGGAIVGSSAEYSTSITTPKLIFTDNLAEGLIIESSDGADYIVCNSTNGSEQINLKKKVFTDGNSVILGTNSSRGILQYANIKNSTIDNTNTLSANTTGTASAWTSNMTLNLVNPYTGQLMNSISFNGSNTAQLDANYIDDSNSNSHRFVLQNINSAHTSANLQTNIEFFNQYQSGMVNSEYKVSMLSASSGQFATVVYDTGHASNYSELRLAVDYNNDIPSFNNFVFWDTQRDGERFMKLVNLITTYENSDAQRQYPTSIHLGNGGDFSDATSGNTFAKIQGNWRADGQGQLKLLARRTASSSAQECGLLITDNAGSNAIQQNQQTNNMILQGIQCDGIADIKYFNGCAIGNSSHLGNGLEYKNSAGSVISGSATGYDNTLELKLKSGGGLTADSDGLYVSGGAGGEWTSGSGTEIVASPHKVIGLFTENLTGSKLTGFGGSGEATLLSGFNHIFGRMDNDDTASVNGGLTIVGYNEGTGNNVGGHSQLVLHNGHTESTDGLCEEVGVFRLENEGDLVIQMGKNQETNTDQIYNAGNGAVYDKMKFYREGGVLCQLKAFDGTDNVLANWNTNRARNATTKGDHTFTLYNHGDNMLFEMICGNNNLISGTDVGGTSVSTPQGFQIEHEDGGDTRFNNSKTKALIFEITSVEKMRVHDNGYVGIGNNNPTAPLFIEDAWNNLLTIKGDGATEKEMRFFSGSGYCAIAVNSSTMEAITFRHSSSPRVGIGTNNPSCPLQVLGYANPSVSGYGFLWNFNDIYARTDFGNVANAGKISIEAEYSVKCMFSVISSDIRIKKDFEDVNDGEALDIINSLDIVKYNYKDETRNTGLKTIGFKAQQVNSILPNAVKIQTEVVPDIMLNVIDPVWEPCETGFKLIYEVDVSGDEYTGNVKFIVLDGEKEDNKIVKYEDGGFVFEKQYDKLICIGREVNDFHLLNKDVIFGVGMSAIQELSRKNNLLMLENNGLLERTQVLEDNNTELQNKISSLETLLSELTARVSFNESALKGLIN